MISWVPPKEKRSTSVHCCVCYRWRHGRLSTWRYCIFQESSPISQCYTTSHKIRRLFTEVKCSSQCWVHEWDLQYYCFDVSLGIGPGNSSTVESIVLPIAIAAIQTASPVTFKMLLLVNHSVSSFSLWTLQETVTSKSRKVVQPLISGSSCSRVLCKNINFKMKIKLLVRYEATFRCFQ